MTNETDKNALFLSVLAKLMQDRATPPTEAYKVYSELDNIIQNDLNNILDKSDYTRAPDIMKEYSSELTKFRDLVMFPELRDKTVVRVFSSSSTLPLRFMGKLFEHEIPNKLLNMKLYIPIVAMDGIEFSLEAMNYADNRVMLSLSEFECIVKGADDFGIDLIMMIKYIIIRIPCVLPTHSIIFQPVYTKFGLSRLLSGVVRDSVYFMTSVPDMNLQRTVAKYISAVIYTDKTKNNIAQAKAFAGIEAIHADNATEHFRGVSGMSYGGLESAFRRNEAEIAYEYRSSITNAEKRIRSITDDLIKMTNRDDKLVLIRSDAEKYRRSSESEMKGIMEITGRITEKSRELQHLIGNAPAQCKNVQQEALDDELICFFRYAEAGITRKLPECIQHLKTLGYSHTDLLKNCAESYNLNDTFNSYIKFNPAVHDWGCAKAIIALCDPEKLSQNDAAELSKGLSHFASTGKEFYVKALAEEKMKKKTDALLKSLDMKYLPAGSKLYSYYKEGEKISLRYLANSLIPEACTELGDEEIGSEQGRNGMLYYKLAASMEYPPAVAKIVDREYEFRFKNAPYIKDDDMEFRRKAETFVEMCEFLLHADYHVAQYEEKMGVVLFSLGKYAESMRRLSGINTPAANYCKGRMYEYGNGVSRDAEQAAAHYRKAGNFRDATKRSSAIQNKLNNTRNSVYISSSKNEPSTDYSKIADYRSDYETTSVSSSSWCFITTAAIKAMRLGDDCGELNELRDFRDKYINSTDAGQALVREYYRIAPEIVGKIDASSDPDREYAILWDEYIHPSYSFIRSGDHKAAVKIYIDMVRMLADRYGIDIKRSIKQQYSI